MDFQKVINELYAEKERLETLIVTLEALTGVKGKASEEQQVIENALNLKHRGRRVVGPEERTEISRRMKNYWATRRQSATEPKVHEPLTR
jgi:hypothetical protein